MSTYEELLAGMQERYRTLTGFDADAASDIGIRLKVLAAELAGLFEELGELQRQVFAQTSSGEYLAMHAQTRGLSRKPAQEAQGMLRFSRETPAANDLIIAAGTVCATKPDPQVYFTTMQDAVLYAGETFAEVSARAVDAGALGNVGTGAVCLMVSAAAGVSSVTNPAAFAGGVDAENDDALRERLLQSYRAISNGTNRAFYYDLAMKSEGVTSANVLPRTRGRGTVDVVVACASAQAQPETIARLEQELAEHKEIGVDVSVRAAEQDVLHIAVALAIEEGCAFENVEAACREKIAAHIASLGVGGPVLLARLGSVLLELEGVYNYRILSPSTDVYTEKDHVPAAGAISISRLAVG